MGRTFWSGYLIDVLLCQCSGRRRMLAGIIDPESITKILAHLGLATAPPPIAPARAPPGGICPGNDKAADWPPTGMPRASWLGLCTDRTKSGALHGPKGIARPNQEGDLLRQPALADRRGGRLLVEFPMPQKAEAEPEGGAPRGFLAERRAGRAKGGVIRLGRMGWLVRRAAGARAGR